MALSQAPSADGVQQVEPAAQPDLGQRLLHQNKAVKRHLRQAQSAWVEPKDLGADTLSPEKQFSSRKVSLGPITVAHCRADGSAHTLPVVSAAFHSDEQATHPIAQRLHGWTTVAEEPGQPERGLDISDLYRAYKHTPHSPPSVFLKYLIHRISRLDQYDDPAAALQQDRDFLGLHQQGGAADKNGHLVPNDLHEWLGKHHGLAQELLNHQQQLHRQVQRGIGLNVRSIDGQPYVALSRGLGSDIMDREHALSSWGDKPNTGFGTYQHRAWVPLRDLWYSYDLGFPSSAGNMGPEDEYLVANTAPRYEAEPHDVTTSRIKAGGGYGDNGALPVHLYDNATDPELAAGVQTNRWGEHELGLYLQHRNAGPLTAAAYVQAMGGPQFAAQLLPTKHTTREQALAVLATPGSWAPVYENPNLTSDDLKTVVATYSQRAQLSTGIVRDLLKHPRANHDTARAIWQQVSHYPDPRVASGLAESPLTPPDVVDEMVQNAVGQKPVADWRHNDYEENERWRLAVAALGNPNSTPAQADAVAQQAIERDRLDHDMFIAGKYGPATVKALATAAAMEPGPDPETRDENYVKRHVGSGSALSADQLKWARDRRIMSSAYTALQKMALNANLPDETVSALIDWADENGDAGPLTGLATRQVHYPLSESNQLKLLGAMKGPSPLTVLAGAKGLAPSVVRALAVLPNYDSVRDTLYRNRSVDPEVLASAWPKKQGSVDDYLAEYKDKPYPTPNSPIPDLARAIRDRRAYAARRAQTHLIRPWPQGLAKSEDGWWSTQLREWLGQRKRQDENGGYYRRCHTLDEARTIVDDRVLLPEPTDEVLDGLVSFAHPARDQHYHAWLDDPEAGEALVHFKTKQKPQQHVDGRCYWTQPIQLDSAELKGIRSSPGGLQKGMPTPRFPGLGVTDDRRSVKTITTPLQQKTVQHAFANASARDRGGDEYNKLKPKKKQKVIEGELRAIGPAYGMQSGASPDLAFALSGGQRHALAQQYGHAQDPGTEAPGSAVGTSQFGTELHEGLHAMFNRVGQQYGPEARVRFAAKLHESLPVQYRGAVELFSQHRSGGMPAHPEEQFGQLLNFLNNEPDRRNFFGASTWRQSPHSNQGEQAFHTRMKRAYQALRAAAEMAHPGWLGKAEGDVLAKMAVIHDNAQQPMTVWRVQNDEGVGPYTSAHKCKPKKQTHFDVSMYDDRPEYPEPLPEGDFSGPDYSAYRKGYKTIRFGFEKPQDAEAWFGADGLADRGKEGFTLRQVLARKVWRSKSAKQVMFEPHEPGLGKSEFELPRSQFDPGERATALAQFGHSDHHQLVLQAAQFLARREPDEELFRQGLAVYSDALKAALHSCHLKVDEANLRALGAVLKLQGDVPAELSKAEHEPVSIHSVVPGNEDAVEAAQAVERASKAGQVWPMKLSGKHSKGAMAARDPKTGYVLLLKPPGGKQSPAAGARDGKVGQARREACFWQVAQHVNLGGVIPRADLIIMNGSQEWSAIRLLGSGWKSLDERNREKDSVAREVLKPYLDCGQLHRWVCLEWALGSTDSHGQNILVSTGGSVALIDHGASFAGENFSPSTDSKSFIPYCLRVWSPDSDFKLKSPEQRMKMMPRLSDGEDRVLRRWLLDDFRPEMVERELAKYGMDENIIRACVARLADLRNAARSGKNLSDYVNGLWAGVEAVRAD